MSGTRARASAADPTTRPSRNPSVVALILVSGTGPFCTDTYLAALPELQQSLGTTASASQLTITTCIIGLAIGLLAGGTVSDSIGRRKLLIGSTIAFLVASLVCMVAPDITTLIVCRLLQGITSGTAASVARAVISDRYTGLDAAKRFGTLATIGLLAPVIAPAVGGLILTVADWRAVFAFMAVLGAAMVVAVIVGIPETRVPDGDAARDTTRLAERIRMLMGMPGFRNAVLVQCFATAGFFVYIGGSSFVLQDGLGADATQYSVIFAVNAAGMAVASLVFRLFITRVSAERFRTAGMLLSTVAAVLLLVIAVGGAGHPPLAAVWALLFFVVGGMGLIQPASTVISQELGNAAPGTAASLQGGLAFLAGAAMTPVTGLLDEDNIVVMAALMAPFLVLGCLLLLADRRRTVRHT